MNEMEIGALQGVLTRIKEMISQNPSQPIKNVSHLLEAVEHLRAADAARVCACKQPQKQYYLRCGVCGGEIPPRP